MCNCGRSFKPNSTAKRARRCGNQYGEELLHTWPCILGKTARELPQLPQDLLPNPLLAMTVVGQWQWRGVEVVESAAVERWLGEDLPVMMESATMERKQQQQQQRHQLLPARRFSLFQNSSRRSVLWSLSIALDSFPAVTHLSLSILTLSLPTSLPFQPENSRSLPALFYRARRFLSLHPFLTLGPLFAFSLKFLSIFFSLM